MLARLFVSPLDEPIANLMIVERARLLDLFPDKKDLATFKEEGTIVLNGEVIPPKRWHTIILKPSSNSRIDFIHVPGSKKTLAIVAAIAAVAEEFSLPKRSVYAAVVDANKIGK